MRENWHHLIAVLIGSVKWAWGALGSQSSRIPCLGSPPQLTVIDKPCTSPAPCTHPAEQGSRLWAVFSCRAWFFSELPGEMMLKQHTKLYDGHFYCACCYVPKNVLCFMGIGMVSLLLSQLSTGTVILFCYFPDRTGPVSFLFHLFGGAGRKCLWLGSAEQPERFLFTGTADSSGTSFQAGFDLAKLLQKWTGPSVLVWSSC